MARQRNDYAAGKVDPLAAKPTLTEADAATYGPVDMPDMRRIVGKPMAIDTLRPDTRQPRRALPMEVRMLWDGNPANMGGVIEAWTRQVEERLKLGYKLPVAALLKGSADSEMMLNAVKDDGVVEGWLEVVKLAGTILRDGLKNPIRVAKNGKIESGERRWLGYWFLWFYGLGDEFAKIPAVQTNEVDVWAQAAENGARAPLNAIGMARQLALLTIAMYEGDDGIAFDDYDAMVLPGEADRRYYAQVANGNVFRIKLGMGERVLQVTGLKSVHQISQYRALLQIPDALWLKADAQNWSENAIREFASSLKLADQAIETLTTVKVSPESGSTLEGSETHPQGSSVVDNGVASPGTRGVPPVTSIGKRMGLYNDVPQGGIPTGGGLPVTRRAPAEPLYDEDYVEDDDDAAADAFDDEEYQMSLALLAADERALAPVPVESVTAITDDWQEAARVLKFLKTGGDEQMRMMTTELLTFSREDVRRMVTMSNVHADWWFDLLKKKHVAIHEAMTAHMNEVKRYLEHLAALGDEFAQKRRD